MKPVLRLGTPRARVRTPLYARRRQHCAGNTSYGRFAYSKYWGLSVSICIWNTEAEVKANE
jgi:hypothetical protein